MKQRGHAEARGSCGGGADRPPWFRVQLAIFLAALALRLLDLYFASRSSPFFCSFNTDDRVYHEWALRIAQGTFTDGRPFFLSPLFPYVLGLVYALFGAAPLAGLLLQAVLSSVTCCFIAAVGRTLCGTRAGILAGAAAALYGPFIFFTEILLSETLHLFLALAAFLLFLKCRGKTGAPAWFGCGVIAGLAALARTYFLLSALLLAFWLAREGLRRIRKSSALIPAGAFLGGVLLMAAIPTVHNMVSGGDFVLINSSGGINFFMGNHEGANGRYHVPPEIPVEKVRNPALMYATFKSLAEKEEGKPLKDSEVSAHFFAKGLAFIKDHPGEWFLLCLKKLGFALESYEYPGDRNYYQAARFSPILAWTPSRFPFVLGLALLGLFALRRRLGAITPLLLLALSALAVLIAFYVTDRYRLALVPFLIVLAGAGIDFLWNAAAAGRKALLAAGLAAAGLVFAGSVALPGLLTPGFHEESYMSFYNLGTQYIVRKDYGKAVKELRRSIDLNPDYLPARSNLALALSQIPGRRKEAAAAWREVLFLAREKGLERYEERALRWLARLGGGRPPHGKDR